MDIPYDSLKPLTLRAVIEEFVLREGTDYGAEVSLDDKVGAVMAQLEEGAAKIVFDAESETCSVVTVDRARATLTVDDTPVMRLDQFLKREGLTSTGGHAKQAIQGGEVSVNDEVETRRKRKLRAGDRVTFAGRSVVVEV